MYDKVGKGIGKKSKKDSKNMPMGSAERLSYCTGYSDSWRSK